MSPSINTLIKTIKCIRRCRKDSVLVTEAGLFDIELANGYSLRMWAGDGRHRDAARYLRNLQQRSPFQGIAAQGRDMVVEYHLDGKSAQGLGLAHLVNGLAVSLCATSPWDRDSVTLERDELTENDDGDLHMITSRVEVRHASAERHVATHEQWLCDEGLVHIRTGHEIWKARTDLFPDLVFLPRVLEDLEKLQICCIAPVKERLAELQRSTAQWDTSIMPTPCWASKVTPESQSRQKLCYFIDTDKTSRLFDMHARFTPGDGRIHFRIDRTRQRLIIAYIGRKIQ